MFEVLAVHYRDYVNDLVTDLRAADTDLALLLILLVASAIVLDAISMATMKKRSATGVGKGTKPISIDGTQQLPGKNYVSEKLGLAGNPDAVLVEDGFIIPVEVKPLANKIRDRYIAQLVVYMRLIEEIEGKRPPYGYLILGSSRRRVKIDNTPERQNWLQQMINEMQSALAGVGAVKPAPHPKKCRKCNVRGNCDFRIDQVVAPTRSKILARRAG